MNDEEISTENSPNVEENVEDVVEDDGPIEKAPPVRKPWTKKQKEAFAKAQLALAEKRKADKEKKEAARKPREKYLSVQK